jgi:Na+/melibiose symporter-like transporter
MAAIDDKPISLFKKLGGLIAIILGFLLAAVGYRDGSTEYLTLGIVLIAIGLVLIVLMIVRRNQGRQV